MITIKTSVSIVVILSFSLVSFAQKTTFDEENHPAAPDYSLESSWSALPFRKDVADVLPKGETWISDSLKEVDLFYVYPTIYQNGPLWNASLDMTKLNKKIDKYPVRLQASVFNASCRVYAPRYRQAVVSVFYNESEDGEKALDLAYQDVKRAFDYYINHNNNGRPFIIAGHSQGTHHTRRLLREMIDTTELKAQMVAAYLIGFTIVDTLYQNLQICEGAEQTGCYVTWMSYREGYSPTTIWHRNTQSINPLTWTTDTSRAVVESYASTVVFNPKKIRTRRMEAQIKDIGGKVLWVKTKAPWFRLMKNLHIADYGLFYMDIRQNVKNRVRSFREKEQTN